MRTVRTGRGGGGSVVDEKGEHETRCHDEVESNAACSIEIVKIRIRGFYEIKKSSASTREQPDSKRAETGLTSSEND